MTGGQQAAGGNHRRAAFLMAVFTLVGAGLAHAQTTQYAFTRIADSVHTDSGVAGPYCVGLNDLGTVVVSFVPAASSNLELWRGDGTSFTQMAPLMSGVCPSLNDLDEAAYLVSVPSTGQVSLVRNHAGVLTTLASSTAPPYLNGGTTYLPSLANGGSAVFQAGSGIYVGPAGTAVYDASTDAQLLFYTTASMNDSLTVAFLAIRPDASAPAGSRVGIYRGSDVPLIEDGAAVGGGTLGVLLARPVINASGRVAFAGSTTGSPTLYTTVDGVNVDVVGTGSLDRFSINDAGVVAYRRNSGSGGAIYIGSPAAIDRKVIEIGDPIDGSTLQAAFLWEEAINNKGQIAFVAQLADGRTGVYRADPISLQALRFTDSVPGCGSVKAKVTLVAPAPPGGLTVQLVSENPAASVPSTVAVKAGRLAATFPITPTPVSGEVVGDITATVGAQTLRHTLTVRPIGVQSLTIAPNPVTGGGQATGTVTLECAAAPSGITVALSSAKPSIAAPLVSSVLVPAGDQTAAFQIGTSAVTASTSVTFRATANGTKKTRKLVVNP